MTANPRREAGDYVDAVCAARALSLPSSLRPGVVAGVESLLALADGLRGERPAHIEPACVFVVAAPDPGRPAVPAAEEVGA